MLREVKRILERYVNWDYLTVCPMVWDSVSCNKILSNGSHTGHFAGLLVLAHIDFLSPQKHIILECNTSLYLLLFTTG